MLDSLATETRVIELTADSNLTIPANPIKVKFAGNVTGTDGPIQDTGSGKTGGRIEDRIYVLDNPAIREYRLLAFDSNGPVHQADRSNGTRTRGISRHIRFRNSP